jgi:hypothetical protein
MYPRDGGEPARSKPVPCVGHGISIAGSAKVRRHRDDEREQREHHERPEHERRRPKPTER